MTANFVGRIMRMGDPGVQDALILTVDGGVIEQVAVAEAPVGSLDFGQRVVMPGFCDPHSHVEVAALALELMVDCRAPSVRSIADIQQAFRDKLDLAETTGWLIGQGNLFLDQKLQERRLPTREELDAVSTDVAIALRAGGHTSALNSKALIELGWEYDDPQESFMGPATVERDSSGRATGLISEMDSQFPITSIDPDELRRVITRGVNNLYVRHGVTTLGEITETLAGAQALVDAVVAGDLPIQVQLYLWSPGAMPLDHALNWRDHLRVPEHQERASVTGIKIFADGGFSGRTAAMLTPYVEKYALSPGSRGDLAMSPDELRRQIGQVLDADLEPIVHTCGEHAQRVLADILVEMRDEGRPEMRVRAEHAPNYISELETIDRWIDAGLVPVTNPGFIQAIGLSLPEYIGGSALTGRFPYRSVLDRGVRLACASDMHMGGDPRQTNPFFGIWCVVTRKGFSGELVEPKEAVTLEEALLMHTTYAAEAMGIGDSRGSLDAGKQADFIVLDRDPRQVHVDDLLDIQVDFVYIAGEKVYERPGAEAPKVVK